MINLLPPNVKKHVRRLYHLRLLGIGFLLLGGVFVSALALLTPSYVLTLFREAAVLTEKSALEASFKEQKASVALEELKDLNYTLDQVDSFEKMSNVVPIIQAVLGARRAGISIDAVSVERVSDKPGVIVTGEASTRETLLQFTQELKRLPMLTDVALPVANLAEAENSRFNISANLREQIPQAPEETRQ